MPRKTRYRRTLLKAVEAFLEGSPVSREHAHRIVKRCYAALNREKEPVTLNAIIWGAFIKALTDSVFYESEPFLRQTQQILQGHAPGTIARTAFKEDYRVYFTREDEQWYAELLSLLHFIQTVPYQTIYEATHQAWLDKATWPTVRSTLSEVALAEQIDEEYWQRKAHLEEMVAHIQVPEEAARSRSITRCYEKSPAF